MRGNRHKTPPSSLGIFNTLLDPLDRNLIFRMLGQRLGFFVFDTQRNSFSHFYIINIIHIAASRCFYHSFARSPFSHLWSVKAVIMTKK